MKCPTCGFDPDDIQQKRAALSRWSGMTKKQRSLEMSLIRRKGIKKPNWRAVRRSICLMFTCFFILTFWSTIQCFSQSTYYRDPTLDTINSGIWTIAANTNNLTADQITKSINTNNDVKYTNMTGTTLPWVDGNPSASNVQNVVINGATNQDALSNLFFGFNTNLIGSNFESSYSMTNDLVDSQTSTNVDIIIPGENGHTYYMGFSYFSSGLLPPLAPTYVRQIIMLLVWFMIYRWIVQDLNQEINNSASTTQLGGFAQSFFGTNISGLTALIYAAAITALLAVALGAILSNSVYQAFKNLSSANILQSSIFTFANGRFPEQWALLTQFLPVTEILASFIYYLHFRYLVMRPAFLGVVALIKWMFKA